MMSLIVFSSIIIGGWLSSKLCSRFGVPSIVGMVVWGIIMGFHLNGYLPPTLAKIEPYLKSFALVVILLRASLGLNRQSDKQASKTAMLMSFIPCIFEGIALSIIFHFILGFSWNVSGLSAFMLAAVSPAIIVPSMLKLKDKGFGNKNDVPTIILAGASVDNIFAIAVFSFFLSIATVGELPLILSILSIPYSLIVGIIPGILAGNALVALFNKKHKLFIATIKTIILLIVSLLLVELGNIVHSVALLGVMATGFIILKKEEEIAHQTANNLSKIWIVAEIILFVLIGLTVDPILALTTGFFGLIIIIVGLLFRSIGVYLSTKDSSLTKNEKIFCAIAYVPKATVQAALGGVALSSGIAEGGTILALAVLAILFTAPIGLMGINYSEKHLLTSE